MVSFEALHKAWERWGEKLRIRAANVEYLDMDDRTETLRFFVDLLKLPRDMVSWLTYEETGRSRSVLFDHLVRLRVAAGGYAVMPLNPVPRYGVYTIRFYTNMSVYVYDAHVHYYCPSYAYQLVPRDNSEVEVVVTGCWPWLIFVAPPNALGIADITYLQYMQFEDAIGTGYPLLRFNNAKEIANKYAAVQIPIIAKYVTFIINATVENVNGTAGVQAKIDRTTIVESNQLSGIGLGIYRQYTFRLKPPNTTSYPALFELGAGLLSGSADSIYNVEISVVGVDVEPNTVPRRVEGSYTSNGDGAPDYVTIASNVAKLLRVSASGDITTTTLKLRLANGPGIVHYEIWDFNKDGNVFDKQLDDIFKVVLEVNDPGNGITTTVNYVINYLAYVNTVIVV